MYRSKGAITVFFSLISVLFLSLLCTSIESARIQGTRAKAAAALDMGLFSMLGEFENRLLEEYDVFALDGAYGKGNFSTGQQNEKLKEYMKYNISPASGGILKGYDPFKLSMDSAKITGISLLTDQKGAAFYQQAVGFMHDNLATETASVWMERQNEAKQLAELGDAYQKDQSSSDSNVTRLKKQQEAEEEARKKEQEEAEKKARENGEETQLPSVTQKETKPTLPKSRNPLETIKEIKRRGLLGLVMGDHPVSKKCIDGDVVSKRSLRKGSLKVNKKYGGLTSDFLFQEYLFERFSRYGKSEEDGMLDYELEYILCGKKSDEKNLKEVVKRLLILREGANFLFLNGNAERKSAAESLAVLIVGEIPVPGLIEAVTCALLLVWAYAESILDLKILMDGGKVPVMKDSSSWNIDLQDIPDILTILKGEHSQKEQGLTYEGYLQILYTIGKKSAYPIRALDIIEKDIRKNGDNPGFRADAAIVKIQGEADFTIPPMFLRVSNRFLGTGVYTAHYHASGTYAY